MTPAHSADATPARPPTAPGVRLVADASWLRLDPGTLAAGSPTRVFRVTPRGSHVLDAIENGRPLPAGHEQLTDRLLAAGAVHPEPLPAAALDDVTIVVPAHGDVSAALRRSLALLPELRAIVVDDASPVPIVLDAAIADVVRLPANRGPSGARNAGLATVETEFVLFVDADAVIGPAALRLLRAHLDDTRVGAVAPRVATPGGPGLLARYEAVRSPLDMGAAPALVRAGTRIGYVPAAALLCRVAALRAIGGFDEGLRYGEDVDLVWRLADAGWAVRYEPRATAAHDPRDSLGGWVRQRAAYGSSAAPLARRHPGALAPVRLGRWGAATWAAAVVHPALGAGIAGAGVAPLARKLRPHGGPRPWRAAARLTAVGNFHAARQLADATTSVWLPAAVVGAAVSRRARWALAAAVLVPPTAEWARRRPRLDPLRYGALHLLDRAAYGLGVWRGVVAEREPAPLLPAIDRADAGTSAARRQ